MACVSSWPAEATARRACFAFCATTPERSPTALVVPATKSSFVLSRNDDEAPWHAGRAGMRYRDLIPDRLSGAFIASHIQVPDAGLVPDYVHFHKIRFQMIYIYKGWVRVLYEDQGPAFVMQAGDCVLQPPFIRHRVLETSGGFEVIEIGHPPEHETFADHQMELPKPTEDPTRDFSGQQWVCHYAANATWAPFRIDGFECRDIGIGAATKDLASVRVARLSGKPAGELVRHDAEFLFTFVLEGGMTLRRSEGDDDRLGAGDAFVVPASMSTAFADCTEDLELLEVARYRPGSRQARAERRRYLRVSLDSHPRKGPHLNATLLLPRDLGVCCLSL